MAIIVDFPRHENKAAPLTLEWVPYEPEQLQPALAAELIFVLNNFHRHYPRHHRARVLWRYRGQRQQLLEVAP